jgi:hypothetical protein
MKKLIIASFIGMICFQSCTKENEIKPASQPLDQFATENENLNTPAKIIKVIIYDNSSEEKNHFPVPKQTPPIYVPVNPFGKN